MPGSAAPGSPGGPQPVLLGGVVRHGRLQQVEHLDAVAGRAVIGRVEGLGPCGQLVRVRYSCPVDPAVVVTTFVVIFPAELPDKSLFASLVLGTRFRPLPVFCGVAAAFAVHVLIAVSIGGVFALLPERLVLTVVSVLFAGGSALLLLGKEDDGGDGAEAARAMADRRPLRVALASFGVVFLGEWGDITQITTANLAARYRDPLSVGVGAALALWSVTALALTVGRGLVHRVPTRLVRRLTGVVLAVLAVVTLAEAVRA
jgi:Ca2+/H+ antiporter, TMEM165/GDT1 family